MNINSLIPYRKKDKWGFSTPDKRIVIECLYEEVGRFVGRLAEVKLHGKWGFIDRQGENFIPCIYDWAKNFSEELAIVGLNGKSCFLDILGDKITFNVYDYDSVIDFSEGLALVKANGKYGFSDRRGNILVPCKYDNAWPFQNGIAIVSINRKAALIDINGKMITTNLYDAIYDFDENDYAKVELNGKEGLIDKSGREMISCQYIWVINLSKKFAEIYLEGGKEFINKYDNEVFKFSYDNYKTGHDVFPDYFNDEEKEEFILGYEKEYPIMREYLEQKYAGALFENLGEFRQGFAWIKWDDLYGFINEKYEEVIPCKYYYVGSFNDGLAFVSNKEIKEVYRDTPEDDVKTIELRGNYGFINKTGREIIPCKYDLAADFENGLARVEINGFVGFIDKNGIEYWAD